MYVVVNEMAALEVGSAVELTLAVGDAVVEGEFETL